MNARTELWLDRLACLPLAYLLNGCARILGHLLHRDHSADRVAVRHIVVAKFAGLGSIVQATPLVRELSAHFPNAEVRLVTRLSNRALVERMGLSGESTYIDDSSPVRLIVTAALAAARLIRARVDLYFDLEVYSSFASVLALVSLSRNRYGLYRQSAKHKKGIYTHLVYVNTRMPISRIYEQLGAAAGMIPSGAELPKLMVSAPDRQQAGDLLARFFPENRPAAYVAVNPNASDLLLERRWPLEHFATLLDRITSPQCPVILTGAPSEREHCENLRARLAEPARQSCFNGAGLVGLGGLMALIEGAAVLITNDSGPMHIAFALGTPTVCLFGPGSPAHYGASGPRVRILYEPVCCSPCIFEVERPPCDGNNTCMQLIDPATVERAFRELLALTGREPAAPRQRHGDEPIWFDPAGRPLGIIVRESL